MKRMNILVVLLGLITLSLVACGTSSGTLEDKTWLLESYGEPGNLQDVLEDTEISVVFDSAEGQVAGSAGCNRYFGSYEVKGNKLSGLEPLGSTMMYCTESIMEQETQYLKALQAAESYQIKDGQLIIDYGQKVLVFRSELEAD
ncbi:META domain-containing protein [Chloroflexota bacterium]